MLFKSVFKNPFAKARDLKELQSEIEKAVDLMRPKHSIEALQTPFAVFTTFGALAGILSTLSGVAYLNFAFTENADPLQGIAIVSLLILAILEVGKKASQFQMTAAFLRGDTLQGYILAAPFLLFTFGSVYTSLQGVKLYFAQNQMAMEAEFATSKIIEKVSLDSIDRMYDTQIASKQGEYDNLNQTSKDLAKTWNPSAKEFSKMASLALQEKSKLESEKRQALADARLVNENHTTFLQGISKKKQETKNSETWIFTLVSEILSLVAVAFANFYYYLGASDQVATQPSLQHEAITAHYVQTDGSPSLAAEVKNLKSDILMLTASLAAGNNLSLSQDLSKGKIGFRQGISSISQDLPSLKGTGCKDEAEFLIKYNLLLTEMRNGCLDTRLLSSAMSVNLATIAYARQVLANEQKGTQVK